MKGNSPEEEKSLELSQAALVQRAATKAEALYARLAEITGMSRQDADSGEVSVIQRKADALSRFVGKHTHLLGGENGGDPEVEEEPKEVKLSPKTREAMEEAVASVIMHDGKIEKDDGGSPIAALSEENEWTKNEWNLAKPAVERLGVLSLNRTGGRHTPYESITIETHNVAAIERLIAEGKLPDYLLEPLQDIKVRLAQKAVGESIEEAEEEEAVASAPEEAGPTADELKGIEAGEED
ncbi:MAG TPA: hypothetical protein VFW77_01060 [Candidatus Saccharimonadales bacterium]|nr:hypothetical protein [Candidatus Saccharimonadales bacterium]